MIKCLTLLACLVTLTATAGLKPIDGKHFLIVGDVFEIDPVDNKQHTAENSLIVVFCEGEIFTAFKTEADGEYQFNLPIGKTYDIVFGGKEYVNKTVTVDAVRLGEMRKGEILRMDMGLFREYDGIDYTFLQDPVAKFKFKKYEGFAPNEDYAIRMSQKTMKCLDSIRSLNP